MIIMIIIDQMIIIIIIIYILTWDRAENRPTHAVCNQS